MNKLSILNLISKISHVLLLVISMYWAGLLIMFKTILQIKFSIIYPIIEAFLILFSIFLPILLIILFRFRFFLIKIGIVIFAFLIFLYFLFFRYCAFFPDIDRNILQPYEENSIFNDLLYTNGVFDYNLEKFTTQRKIYGYVPFKLNDIVYEIISTFVVIILLFFTLKIKKNE